MEDAFEQLKKQGKNDVDNLILWMKESKIIDNSKEAEQKARVLLEDSTKKQVLELAQFKQVLEKIAVQQRKSVEDLTKNLADQGEKMLTKLQSGMQAGISAFKDAMEEAYEKMKKEGKTDVDSLVKWMKDSKVIEEAKGAEDRARAYFSDVADKKNVELAKFKEALNKEADKQKKNLEDLTKSLMDQKPRVMDAFKAGFSAFKDAFNKKEG